MMNPQTSNEPTAPAAQADDVLLLLAGLDGAPVGGEDRRAVDAFGPDRVGRMIAEAYAPPAAPPAPAPVRLGRFELIDFPGPDAAAGCGWFSKVWKARRPGRAEPVAVQVVPEAR